MSLRLWDQHVVPRLADVALRGHEVGDLRARTCSGLGGRVLEIGFGSGLNARWYPATVDLVSAVEPSDVAWQLSQRRRDRVATPVVRAGLDGQALDLPDASHDAALVTFSLCTIPDAAAALAEIRRTLRPGGRLHFLEHGLAPDPRVQRWQRRLDPIEKRVAGGCHLSRDPLEVLAASGWEVVEHVQRYLEGPRPGRPWTFVTGGIAR